MTSVVIAAHNEASVIDACLAALLASASDPPEIVVVANGCDDDTAEMAQRAGVVVVDLPTAGKSAALNVGDSVATAFPRVYLDADVVLSPRDLELLVLPLREGRALASAPDRAVDTAGCGLVVRQYYRVLARHPAYVGSLFGRGAVAVSEHGRSRFGGFPALLGDDFFLDSIFAADEKAVVPEVVSVVRAPTSTRALVRRLARVRLGNAQLRSSAVATGSPRPAQGLGWLIHAVRAEPALAPAAAIFGLVTVSAALLARRSGLDWGHDRPTAAVPTVVGTS